MTYIGYRFLCYKKRDLTDLEFGAISNTIEGNDSPSNNVINVYNLPVTYSDDNPYSGNPPLGGYDYNIYVTFSGNKLYNPKTISFKVVYGVIAPTPPDPGDWY